MLRCWALGRVPGQVQALAKAARHTQFSDLPTRPAAVLPSDCPALHLSEHSHLRSLPPSPPYPHHPGNSWRWSGCLSTSFVHTLFSPFSSTSFLLHRHLRLLLPLPVSWVSHFKLRLLGFWSACTAWHSTLHTPSQRSGLALFLTTLFCPRNNTTSEIQLTHSLALHHMLH